MTKPNDIARPEPRVAKGFRDIEAAELNGLNEMLQTIRGVYERYGFEALETPALEYTDALGKFLPDQDRPNAGVFSLQDEDEQWMSLRYDLTAPLARYVAQNFQSLPKPFRRYAFGPVYRNEKPGPGRFKQLLQFDADTVGSDSVAADAEMCMLAADTLEALGIERGDYVIKVNNRKILDGLRDAIGLGGVENAARWLTVMRALDKFDRLKREGVKQLLGPGRKDESGDVTPGANLGEAEANILLQLLGLRVHVDSQQNSNFPKFNPRLSVSWGDEGSIVDTMTATVSRIVGRHFEKTKARGARELETLEAGIQEIEALAKIFAGSGYDDGQIIFDTSVVRGLEYYTGPVFEAELTFEVKDYAGDPVRFGSVGGGGRYDDLVARFTGERVPATGFSIGVSRLQAALALVAGKKQQALGPVVVLVMDKAEISTYQKLTQTLRNAGIRTEMYLGSSGMKAQMKYADKRNSPCVIIQGSDERAKGEVTIKDLIEGAKAAAAIQNNKDWKAARPAQLACPEADMVAEVRKILALHTS